MALAAPTELAHYSSTAAALTHTTAAALAAAAVGSLVVVTVSMDGWTASNFTDLAGNTYTRTIGGGQTGGTSVGVFWSIITSPIVSGTTTWTLTLPGSGSCNISVQAFGGIAASGTLDKSASAGISAGTDANSGNTAALANNDVLLVGACALNAATLTVTPEALTPAWAGVTTNPLTNTVAGVRRLYAFWRELTGGGTPRFDATTSAAITSAATAVIAFQAVQSSGVIFNPLPFLKGAGSMF